MNSQLIVEETINNKLDLTIMQGPKGDTGATGPQGPKGDTGSQGIQGPQGIQGIQGVKGETGKPFTIAKTYETISAMNSDLSNMQDNDFVMIASSVETEDNAKLYMKKNNEWVFITDFSGATGIQGEKGEQGEQGIQGPQGETGSTGPKGDTYTITTSDYQAIAQIIFNEYIDGDGVDY